MFEFNPELMVGDDQEDEGGGDVVYFQREEDEGEVRKRVGDVYEKIRGLREDNMLSSGTLKIYEVI